MLSKALVREVFSLKDEKVIAALCQMGCVRYYEKNEIVFAPGAMEKNIYLMVQGMAGNRACCQQFSGCFIFGYSI